MEPPRQISGRRLAWLRREMAAWQDAGLIGPDAANAIVARYVVSRRSALERLAVLLGAVFIGIGLIWLVAANLDHISPLSRFAGITAVWLVALVAGELLAHRAGTVRLTGAVRSVAALAYGGMVFQAAQSLQVPAYEPGLLGAWAGGVLVYAYATGGLAPLIVAIVTGVGWYVWLAAERLESAAGFALAVLVAAGLATPIAALHQRLWRQRFARPWRQAGALLTMLGLFIAALPGTTGLSWSAVLGLGLAAVGLASVIALLVGDEQGRYETLAVAGMVAVAAGLVAWAPADAGETVRAIAGTAVYVLAAAWFALVGTRRRTPYLVFIAMGALVVFVVTQSFAVFASILSGAALFLVLGGIFFGTGALAIYGRRRLLGVIR